MRFLDTLGGHEDFEVVPASAELFQRGVELFRARPDKGMVADRLFFFLVDSGYARRSCLDSVRIRLIM